MSFSLREFFENLFSPERKKESDQQNELDYRMKIATLKRESMKIRKDADRSKLEAITLEQNGQHAQAVAKAAVAANQEKSYQTALRTVSTCESLHAQAKTQNVLKALMLACKEITVSVTDEVDVEGAVRAQAQLEHATMIMEDAQEQMAAFQEGFAEDTDPELRNSAGEEALAKIMSEYAAKNEGVKEKDKDNETVKYEKKAIPETVGELEKAGSMDTTKEKPLVQEDWLKDRRKEIAEILDEEEGRAQAC